jgi:transcriptional regulator with XRE-family HTH domain
MTDQPHPVDIHVGARLRLLRKERRISQSVMAERLGLTFQQIQKYERGTNRISASKLFDAAKVLGVFVSDFYLGLETEPLDLESNRTSASEADLLRIARRMQPAELEKLVTVAEVMAR